MTTDEKDAIDAARLKVMAIRHLINAITMQTSDADAELSLTGVLTLVDISIDHLSEVTR